MRRRLPEVPTFEITPILRELGMEDVPTGYGWVRCRCFATESHANGDRSKSAAVNHEKQRFACHACGRGGDALNLLQSELGLTFPEALEKAKLLTGQTEAEPMKRKRRASDLLKGGL